MHDWGTCGACGASNVDVWGDEPHTYCAACCDDAVYGPTASTSLPPLRKDRLIGAALLRLEREGKLARTDELKESVRDGGPRRVWQSL
jgi:hypothetical protein